MHPAIRFKWFSVLDRKSGYYQLKIEPSDLPKTVFTTLFGTWQFLIMPQGLMNSLPKFQQTMENVMERIKESLLFFKISFSDILEEHEHSLFWA